MWDAFKAWARGEYISCIAVSAQSLDKLEKTVSLKEAAYVDNPDPNTYGAWQYVLGEVSLLQVEITQKSLLNTAQSLFLSLATKTAGCWHGWPRVSLRLRISVALETL